MTIGKIIPLVLTSVLASIPVALPATFTLAAAVGARSLAALGILPTRLSAVDEAASIDVLCADKTGTLTCNELTVTAVRPSSGFDEAHVLGLAALASSDGGQDPVDAAIGAAAARNRAADLPKRTTFVPFDPATKMSEATAVDPSGAQLRVVKGAFTVIAGLTQPEPTAAAAATDLEANGFRVLAVAVGLPATLRIAGIIALSDPPRTDSVALITELLTLGVRTVMVTGDAPETAAIVAHAVGLEGTVRPPGPIPDHGRPEDFAVFAGVLPEDKYKLVKAFQEAGHTVGMCGDGAQNFSRAMRKGCKVVSATALGPNCFSRRPASSLAKPVAAFVGNGAWTSGTDAEAISDPFKKAGRERLVTPLNKLMNAVAIPILLGHLPTATAWACTVLAFAVFHSCGSRKYVSLVTGGTL
jgi:H+-transporting ATPase